MARPRVRGEVPANKAGAGAEGSRLWREEPQEGIDGRRRLALVTARIRRGMNALKTTVSELPKGMFAAALIERTDARQNVKRAALPERGADRDGRCARRPRHQNVALSVIMTLEIGGPS